MRLILSLIIIALSSNIYSQEKKFKMGIEYGYFNSTYDFASDKGDYLAANFGYKVNEYFWLNLDVIRISASGNFEKTAPFINSTTNYTNTIIAPNFSKDFKLSNKLILEPALGAALIFEKLIVPSVEYDNDTPVGIKLSNEGDDFNLGLYGNVALKYAIINDFYIGLNVKTFIPIHLDPEFLAGISLGVKF